MKTTQLLFAILLLPLLMFGQLKPSPGYELKTGKPYPVVDANTKSYFYDGSMVNMVKINKNNIVLQKYNAETNQEISRKLLPPLKKGEKLLSIQKIKNTIYIFTLVDIKATDRFSLYARPVNFENNSIDDRKKIIDLKSDYRNQLDFYISFDDSKILITNLKYQKYKDDKKNYDVIDMIVFNNELEIEWNKEVQMPYTEAQMNNIEYAIDSKGIAYIITEVYNSSVPKKFVNNKKNYHLELMTIIEGEISTSKIDDKGTNVNSIRFHEVANNKMFLVGYYNDNMKTNNRNSDGVFVAKLDDNRDVETVSNYKFPLEIINQFESKNVQEKNKRKAKKGKLDFPQLVLRNIILGDDGSVLLVGEQYYSVTTTTTSTNGMTTSHTTYYYLDVLLTKINADGGLAWMRKLPKSQRGERYLGGMSYKYVYHHGFHYILYLDNLKNIDLPLDKAPVTHIDGRGGIFTAYKVSDADGTATKASLLNIKEVKIAGNKKPLPIYQFSVNRILQTPTGFVFEAYKKQKQDVMINVKFEEN